MKERRQIDGAYRRQIILSELTMCEKIYVVKPEPCGIQPGDMPTNFFGIQDFQTEIWMNSTYDSQVAELSHHAARHALKRALQAAGKSLPTPVPMDEPKTITLVPISRKKPLGFFNYFVEQLDNFNLAREQALVEFNPKLDRSYRELSGEIKSKKPRPPVQIFSEI